MITEIQAARMALSFIWSLRDLTDMSDDEIRETILEGLSLGDSEERARLADAVEFAFQLARKRKSQG